MARKLKMEAEKNYYMLKDRQKITEEDLAKSKVKLEKAQREVSSLDQRLGRATEENRLLRKKAGTQVTNVNDICLIFISLINSILKLISDNIIL